MVLMVLNRLSLQMKKCLQSWRDKYLMGTIKWYSIFMVSWLSLQIFLLSLFALCLLWTYTVYIFGITTLRVYTSRYIDNNLPNVIVSFANNNFLNTFKSSEDNVTKASYCHITWAWHFLWIIFVHIIYIHGNVWWNK